ncbi:MAG: UvrD-helicase domain-containing protein [Acidobacteria bacterium]|nr:UvrD-helicase domain-containing protein [Acidobacteriota bacterium]
MTRPQLIPDELDRKRAATEFDRNLVVSAAAGTGKTSLLVERILNAVGSGRYRLDQLAAVTFTRKAAAEMRERLAKGFQRLHVLASGMHGTAPGESLKDEAERAYAWLGSEAKVSDPTLARRALDALENLDRFSASTIHSFCAEVLRQHPIEASVDPAFQQDEGAHFDEIFKRQWQKFLESELGESAPHAELWREALQLYSLGEMEKAARALCEFGIPDPDRWPSEDDPPARMLAPLLTPIIQEATSILSRGTHLWGRFEDCLRSVIDLAEAFQRGAWGGGAAEPPALAFDVLGDSSTPAVGKKAEGIDPERARGFANLARRKLQALRNLDERASRSLVEPLRRLVKIFREAYLGAGWVSFEALLTLTRDLLRDHPDVRTSLRERYQHFLVDEFQDTSPVQYEILFRLAAAEPVVAGQDVNGLKLENGRLFIVGDPKQSIYRFRKADVSAYERAMNKILGDGGEHLDLTANFRSDPRLIGALNSLFEKEFAADRADPLNVENQFQPEYHPMAPTLPEGPAGHPVEIWSCGDDPQNAVERRAAEARAIADWLVHNAGGGKTHPFKEVAILFRAMTGAAVYLEALRRASVPFVVEGGKEFLDRPEVRHLRALLTCLARPHDGAAVLAFLRSPAGGAGDGDLLEHVRVGGGWSLEAPPAGSPQSVQRAVGWIKTILDEFRELPVDEQVSGVLERSGLELAEASHPDGAQAFANLKRYALAVGDAAREQALSLEQALSVVDSRSETGAAGVEESPLADETLDAVRVLTVHKAKGMEFDVVILPDLCRKDDPPSGDGPLVQWIRPPFEGLAVGTNAGVNARRIAHDFIEAHHEKTEALRILYVACTRARQRLILIGGPARTQDAKRRWPAVLRRWGYSASEPPRNDGPIHEAVTHCRRIVTAQPRPAREEEVEPDEKSVSRFTEAVRKARAASREWDRTPSGLVEARWKAQEAADAPGARSRGELGAAIGRVIHQALEAWDGSGDGGVCLREAVKREAIEGIVPEGKLSKESESLWKRVLDSDLSDLLKSGKGIQREVPILMGEENGNVWRGSIDLLYPLEGGWVVADYKTDDPGPDPDQFARRYLPQLRVYARAVQQVKGRLPRAEIIWIRTGKRTVFAESDLEQPLTPD